MEYARFRNRRLNLLVRYHIILWSSLVKTFGMADNKVWYISLIQLKPNLK